MSLNARNVILLDGSIVFQIQLERLLDGFPKEVVMSRDYAYPNADSSPAGSSGDCADSAESGFLNEEKSEELGLNSVSVEVKNV